MFLLKLKQNNGQDDHATPTTWRSRRLSPKKKNARNPAKMGSRVAVMLARWPEYG